MSDFLTRQRAELDKRLKELRPLVDEYLTLEKAKQALEALPGARRGPGRPAGSGKRAAAPVKRRRRRGGTRGDQALKVVRANPGITVAELAKQLKIKQPNYLYRVMNGLQADGKVKKKGRGYEAA